MTLLNIKDNFEMSGVNYLLDTNIIIYSIKGKLTIDVFVKDEDNLFISSIIYIASLGFPFQDRDEEVRITKYSKHFERIFLTKEIERQIIFIRKSKKIKLPDALIAAIAMINNLILVTHNVDDFKNIEELKILNSI